MTPPAPRTDADRGWRVRSSPAIVRLVLILPRLDPAKNCFSYITTTVHNELRSLYGAEARQARQAERLGWTPEEEMRERNRKGAR